MPSRAGPMSPVWRAGALLLALLGSAVPAVSTHAGVYHVDVTSPTCSASGPGTEVQPFCSITAALNAHHEPGDTILVKPGVYREQVAFPGSGIAGAPLVVRASGPWVIVDGSDDYRGPTLWTPHSGGVWVAAGVTWSPRQVFVDGTRMAPTTLPPDSLPLNTFTWVAGQGLYLNLGVDPGSRQTFVGRRSHGFKMYGRAWVTIEGFTVTRTEDRGIFLQGPTSNVRIAGNLQSLAGEYGIQSVGGTGHVIVGNRVSDNLSHGIGLINGATGCTVSRNESFRNADPISRSANGIYLFAAPGNVLSGNRIHDNQDSGLHLQSGSNDCLVLNNVSFSNGDHGFDNLNTTGTIYSCNVAWGNHFDGFSIEGASHGVRLENSIAVDNGINANHYDLWVDTTSVATLISDYNVFWNSTNQQPIRCGLKRYATLAAWQAERGLDLHSLQLDPRFTAPSSGDFRLLPDSPAIDSGDSSFDAWPATDADGRARVDVPWAANGGAGPVEYGDRGAYEFDGVSVGIGERRAPAPGAAVIPNPLSGRGVLRFRLPQPARPTVQLLDVAGRVVRRLEPGAAAGEFQLALDDRDALGRPLTPGVYFYRVSAPGSVLTGRFLVIR